MTCPVCKRENIGRSLTCAFCGADLPLTPPDAADPKPAAPPKRPKHPNTSKKVVSVISASLLLVMIGIAIWFFSRGSGDYVFMKQDVAYFSGNTDARYTVFVNGEKVGNTVSGRMYDYQSSLDNRVTLFRAINYGTISYYLLDGRNLRELEDSDHWLNVELSESGEKIAYTVFNEDNSESSLYLYDIRERSAKLIDTGANIRGVALSPDGDSLLYERTEIRTDYDYSNPTYGPIKTTTVFSDGENRVELGYYLTPIALSNSGKYIYVKSTSGTIDVYNNQGELIRQVGSLSLSTSSSVFDTLDFEKLYFNAGHTQMLCFEQRHSWIYISVDGSQETLFFGGEDVRLILPENTQILQHIYEVCSETYPVNSFYDLFYYSNGEIYQVKNGSQKDVLLASDVNPYTVTMTGDSSEIYYQDKSGNLYKIKTAWGDRAPEKAVKLAWEMTNASGQYAPAADGSRIYYRNDKGELFCVTEDGKTRNRISDGVSDLFVSSRNDMLYYFKDGDLYGYEDGKEPERLLWNAFIREISPLGYCYIQSEGEIYCVDGSDELKMILKTSYQLIDLPYYD